MKLNWIYLIIIILFSGCREEAPYLSTSKEKKSSFKQSYSVTLHEMKGSKHYDNSKEYDYVFETKYLSIDKLYEKTNLEDISLVKSVLVFCDTTTYSAVIEKISKELPPSEYEIDFAVIKNGVPSLITQDLFKTSETKSMCSPGPNIFQININKDLLIFLESEFVFKFNEIDTLEYFYNNFYSEDYYGNWNPPGKDFKDSNELNNYINSLTVYSEKSLLDSVYYSKLKSVFMDLNEITTYRKNFVSIDPNFNSKINIQYILELTSLLRLLEEERIKHLYPEKSKSELKRISNLLSPQIMYHGPIWNNMLFNDPPPPPPPINN